MLRSGRCGEARPRMWHCGHAPEDHGCGPALAAMAASMAGYRRRAGKDRKAS
ncbi:hypothetical protein [Kibdelosporangium philippinense]|uniref:hypothetical protein n=1 Tax=Kibdelosporangium philippinense TaxID=211113 RepID=UPI003607059C